MRQRSKSPVTLFAIAIGGFATAICLFLFEQALAAGLLQSVCATVAYVLLAGAVLTLSYAVFVRSAQSDERHRVQLHR